MPATHLTLMPAAHLTLFVQAPLERHCPPGPPPIVCPVTISLTLLPPRSSAPAVSTIFVTFIATHPCRWTMRMAHRHHLLPPSLIARPAFHCRSLYSITSAPRAAPLRQPLLLRTVPPSSPSAAAAFAPANPCLLEHLPLAKPSPHRLHLWTPRIACLHVPYRSRHLFLVALELSDFRLAAHAGDTSPPIAILETHHLHQYAHPNRLGVPAKPPHSSPLRRRAAS
jgi:hypothetical protein